MPKQIPPNLSELLPIVKCFYHQFFPSAYAVLLSGSVIDHKTHPKSDIDLIVFMTDRDQCFNEDFEYQQLKIQVVVIAVQLLPTLLQEDYAHGTGNQIGMIAKGHIVYDSHQYLFGLIDYCKKVYAIGPAQKPKEDIRLLYLDVMQLYQKIHSDSFEDNFYQVPDLANKIALLNLYYHRCWASNRKFLFKQLHGLNPVFQQRLFEATVDFFKTKNTQTLREAVAKNLSSFTDLSDLQSNNTGFTQVKGMNLILCLPIQNTDIQNISKKIYAFLTTILQVNNEVQSYFYRTFSAQSTLQEYDSLVIVLSGNNQSLNNLLPQIQNVLQSADYQLINKIKLPVNIDIKLGFGKKYALVQSLFIELSNAINKDKSLLSATKQILVSIDLIISFGKAHFKDKKQFVLFLKYVFKCWFPKAYDTGQVYGFAQIVQAKEHTQSLFFQNVAKQTSQIYPFVASLLDWKSTQTLGLIPKFGSPFLLEKPLFQKTDFDDLGLHPQFDFLPANINIAQFNFLKNTLERFLGILLIEESQKPYLIYLIQELYAKK